MGVSIGRQVGEAIEKRIAGDGAQALLHIMLAIAATSRRKYRNKRDGEAFRRLVKDNIGVITAFGLGVCELGGLSLGSPLRKIRTLESILYHIRCNIVHELSLPDDVELTDNIIGGSSTVLLPEVIVHGLIAAVVVEPVNSRESVRANHKFAAFGSKAAINEYWGKKNELLNWLKSARNASHVAALHPRISPDAAC